MNKTKQRDPGAELREDIRLLGRLLGDTIREQVGAEVFDLVESIRRTAIRYRKDHDAPSLKHLDRTIGRLGPSTLPMSHLRESLHASEYPPTSYAMPFGTEAVS